MTDTNAKTENCPATEFAINCGLTMATLFIPQSMSRNAGEARPTVNWRVRITDRDGHTLCTDYTQGIGHARLKFGPGPKPSPRSVMHHDAEIAAAERGIGAVKPTLTDVLYSLVMDSDAAEYASFEEWAESLGYDTDSREAERIYNECRATARTLTKMIDPDTARKAFADY